MLASACLLWANAGPVPLVQLSQKGSRKAFVSWLNGWGGGKEGGGGMEPPVMALAPVPNQQTGSLLGRGLHPPHLTLLTAPRGCGGELHSLLPPYQLTAGGGQGLDQAGQLGWLAARLGLEFFSSLLGGVWECLQPAGHPHVLPPWARANVNSVYSQRSQKKPQKLQQICLRLFEPLCLAKEWHQKLDATPDEASPLMSRPEKLFPLICSKSMLELCNLIQSTDKH